MAGPPKPVESWSFGVPHYFIKGLLLFTWKQCLLIILKGYLKVKVYQSCSTLCDPMDYTVHGILQARILEWVTCPFSRGSSWPRNRTRVSCTAGGFFTNWTIREAQWVKKLSVIFLLLSILSEIHLISESHQETLMHWYVELI